MGLVLPPGHPAARLAVPETAGAVRVGIVNIMPQVEAYEPSLLAPLARAARPVEPVFVRLESHGYTSSDHGYLDRFYRPYALGLADGPLDGLIVTGAPVEELPFEAVRYWDELAEILTHARANVRSTLGLCWGGLALGATLGLDKVLFPRKLFGVYENRALEVGHPLAVGGVVCAHSRHSGIADATLERAAAEGRVRLLTHGALTGYTMFESADGRFVAHLGHPEYEAERIVFEWTRDQKLGRTDVDPPHAFDVARPETTWRPHREAMFARWVEQLGASTVE